MNSKLLSIILIVAVVLVAGCTQGGQQSTPTPAQKTATPQATQTPAAVQSPTQAVSTPASTPTATSIPVATKSSVSTKSFTLDVTHSGYSFKDSTGASTSQLKVSKGDTVKIMATSTPASHKHGITIDQFNVNKEITAAPGSPGEITFTVDKAGTFEIYCKTCLDGIAGAHPQLKGSLVVE